MFSKRLNKRITNSTFIGIAYLTNEPKFAVVNPIKKAKVKANIKVERKFITQIERFSFDNLLNLISKNTKN